MKTDYCFFCQAEDGIRDIGVTGVQTCALPISRPRLGRGGEGGAGRPGARPLARRVRRQDPPQVRPRSEERRVGKEGRSWWAAVLLKNNIRPLVPVSSIVQNLIISIILASFVGP